MTADPSVSVPQPNPSAALDLDQIEARLASDRLVSPVLDVLVREDVPALVAEVRRLREQVAAGIVTEQSSNETARQIIAERTAERDAARAEAERLREAWRGESEHGHSTEPCCSCCYEAGRLRNLVDEFRKHS